MYSQEFIPELENFIEDTIKLQNSSIGSDIIYDKPNIINKISLMCEKGYSLIHKDTRGDILVYYKLYMLYIISWFGNVFLYIQLAEIIQKKDSSSMSMIAFIILLITGISWFIYGFLIKDPAILVSGVVRLIGVTLLLIFIPKYKDGPPK